ncbi:MAG TPA: carbonic anhydrase family protein [Gammaproteobacteria bacterium]|nr:carbonic anhydrase family protein [Gammaproteobacteria bacterium]
MIKTATKAAFFASIIISAPMVAIAGAGHGDSHWGYSGHGGPEHWADISKEFALCGSGKEQSPIDISDAKTSNLPAIQFDYKPGSLEILNNGHTIQVNRAAGSSITVGGEKYELLQFHFHTPSENTVGGKAFPMEMHLVHKNAKGQLAVVGVFSKAGGKNAVLDKAWKHMPHHAGDKEKVASVSINAADLLPADRSYYSFKGSLTTPPCSEGVKWMVLKTPTEASSEQIKQFTKVIGANARPVQPMHERMVNMM